MRKAKHNRPTAKQVEEFESKLVKRLIRKRDRTGVTYLDYLKMEDELMKFESGKSAKARAILEKTKGAV